MRTIREKTPMNESGHKETAIVVYREIEDKSTTKTVVSYRVFSNASVPDAQITMLAEDRFGMERDLKNAVMAVFKKYQHLDRL